MSDTIRELILQDVAGLLESLYGASSVHRGRTQFEYADLPCVTILPEAETAERVYGEQQLTMPVAIHAVQVVGNKEVGTLAEDTLGELISSVIGSRLSLSRIDDIYYTEGGVETWPEQEEQALSVQISIEVKYSTKIGDPYNQTNIGD